MAGPHVEVVTTSDSDDDLGILQTTAGNAERGFPLQAAERIYAGLASQTSSFNMEDVLSCMRMSIAALENETSGSEKDARAASSFVMELLKHTYIRLMSEEYLSYMSPPLHMVFKAACLLVELAAALGSKAAQHANDVNEVLREHHIGHMSVSLQVLGHVLEICLYRFSAFDQLAGSPGEGAEPPPSSLWHALLVKQYVQCSGLNTCIQVLESPELYPLHAVESVVSIVSKASCSLQEFDGLCQSVTTALDHFIEYLDGCVTEDQERLSDGGRDRTFIAYSRIMDNLYSACMELTLSNTSADRQISVVQRRFVLEMLKSANFNKLLSAVRECLSMLRRSAALASEDKGASLKANAQWLDQGSIVQKMLRANLHQRQYADLIFHILQVLANAQLICAEHLEMLWAVTEQEGTFDEIKVNVYQMIESLASGLSQAHLELLFSKFQSKKGRSVTDTLRLVDLLRKLAKNDIHSNNACMAERLLDLMWQLTMSADAPREVLHSNVLTETLMQYREQEHIEVYLARCIDQLRGKQGIFTALHLLFLLIKCCKNNELQNELCGKLESKFQIHKLLVDSLRDFMQTAARWVAGRTTGGGQVSTPPGQGCYSYHEIMQEYVTCIRFFANSSANFYAQELAEQLWDMMVLHPVHPDDVNLSISLLLSPDGNVAEYLCPVTLEALLMRRIMALNSETLSKAAWDCFWQFFVAVNTRCKHPRMSTQMKTDAQGNVVAGPPAVTNMAELEGLSYLWQVVLTSLRPDVCDQAKAKLLLLYSHGTEPSRQAMFIDACTSQLMAAVEVLGAAPSENNESAKRSAHRLLCLLTTKLEHDQGCTLPPVPSHRSSFKGPQMVLDVAVHGLGNGRDRTKLVCHANEYVGMIRKRLAQHMSCEPQKLRLMCAGDEWRCDTPMLSQAIHKLSSRQTPVIAALSLQDNTFTVAPAGFSNQWHSSSTVAMLSNMDRVYDALFLLADVPGALDVRHEAVNVLQLLTTRTSIAEALRQALRDGPASNVHKQLKSLLLGAPGGQLQPAKLLYTLQALHGLLFPIAPPSGPASGAAAEARDATLSPSAAAALLWQSGGLAVAAACLPLLTEVLDLVLQRNSPDVGFMRELFSVVTHFVSNMVSSHLQLQSTGADGAPPPAAPALASTAMLSSIPEAAASTEARAAGAGCRPGVAATQAAASRTGDVAMQSSPEVADAGDGCGTPQDVLHQCENLVLGTPKGISGPPGPRIGDDIPVDPEQLPPGQLSAGDLATVVALLIRLALHVGQLSQQHPGKHCGLDTFTDVQLVRDCLTCLDHVLKQHPDLDTAFLDDARSEEMVRLTLLNAKLLQMRNCARELLKSICLKTMGARGCNWLLRLLARLSRDMQGQASTKLPFFSLYKEAVTSMPQGDEDARTLADAVLQEEVSSLYDCPEQLMAPGNQALLEGKLKLVRELVRVLDKVSVGGAGGGRTGLVPLLLRSYLFPEAATVALPDANFGNMEIALERCCTEPNAREAAMDLVVDMCTPSASNMDEALTVLYDIHFQQGPITITKQDIQMMDNLRQPNQYIGLRNGGATCYMNAVLQQLFMQPRIRELVLGAPLVEAAEQPDSMFHQLQVLFAHLCFGRTGSHNPRHFWSSFKDYDGVPVDVKEHQDAYEFFTRLQDCVDSHLSCSRQTPAMQYVMGGRFAQQIICKDVNYRSELEEDFYQISVDVKGKGCLEKSLEAYVQGELMEGENAYFCEKVGRRVTALKRMCIKRLPQTLVIHLKRFEYDHLNAQRYKVKERFEFPVTLDMFRYTADGLEALEGSPAQVAAMSEATGGRPRNYYIYELKGVVVHSGSAFAGHYYSFIKERPKVLSDGQVVDGKWFLFDDKNVREWSLEHLDEDCYGGPSSAQAQEDRPHSAYMLFYERKDAACFEAKPDAIRMPQGAVHAAAGRSATHAGTAAFAATACARTTTGLAPHEAAPAAAVATSLPTAADVHADEAAGVRVPGPSESVDGSLAAAAQLQPQPEAEVQTPYGMPVQVYEDVLRSALLLMLKLHVDLDEYGRFIRLLVDGREDVGRAVRRSKRRKGYYLPAAASEGYASASSGGATPEHGSTSPVRSGPPSVMGEAARSTPPLLSPSQFIEECELASCQSVRLATLYTTAVLLPSSGTGQPEINEWCTVLETLMARGSRPCIALLEALLDCHTCVRFFLQNRWCDSAQSVLADVLREAFRCLNEQIQSSATFSEVLSIQVINMQHQFFVLLDTIGCSTPGMPTRAHLSCTDVAQVYSLMTDMLQIATQGAQAALLHADIIPHALHTLTCLLELQSVKNTNRFLRDIVAVFLFLARILERLEPRLLPSLLPSDVPRSNTSANPYAARLRTGPLLLQPQHVRLIAAHLETHPLLRWLLDDPTLLAYDEVFVVLCALSWENPRFSHELLLSALLLLQSPVLMEEDDVMWDLLMTQLVKLLLATKDTYYEQRLGFFCQFPAAGHARPPGLCAYLTLREHPLLQLTSWWCTMSLASCCEGLDDHFLAWMRANPEAVREMLTIAAEHSEPQDKPLYNETITEKYREVMLFLSGSPTSEQQANLE